MKALIIDDDLFHQKALAFNLSQAGHAVAVAGNGQEAIDYIGNNKDIDLIVCDVMMPVLSGPSFILMLKRYFTTKMPAVIIVSGVRDGEAFVKKMDIAYDHFFKKPLSYDAFNEVIAQLAAVAP